MTVQHYIKKDFQPGIEKDIRLLYVCEADESQANYPSLLHSHNDRLELVYVYKGEGIHRIGNNLYHTQAGYISVFNSNVLHDEMARPDIGMGFFNCAVKGLKINTLPENWLIPQTVSPILKCGDISWCVEDIFRQMKYHLSNNREGAELICQYLMDALLCMIMNQIPFEADKKNTEDNELIIEVKSYIDTHYSEKLTFDSLCEKLHISESFLSHKFKKVTGFSPVQYITRRRMGKAQTLLISSDESITEIGAVAGYENTSYFNMLFKKIIGMTPLEYRRYWVGKEQYRKLDALNQDKL
ncbi:helix-turn-helix transcriptional regulator [Pectinatus haikarae]|uniref:AraC-like DNA-binding protein n=1 Tax=Pectinatus haikarae TaxID=349096 RepID=A0ABT9Y8J1_9FIRM|nr:AraC family transcriptional regulator [Pectinatus haikarae]MDQ0204155.1 AraC-like DNA-binding protein [Pectinatus haikarae]